MQLNELIKLNNKKIDYLAKLPLTRFIAVGAAGLSLNIVIVYLLRQHIGLVPARVISYLAAFTMTWFLNRSFTFHSKDPKKIKQWGRYASIYICTGFLHIIFFAFLVTHFIFLNHYPIWAILITAAFIAFINFSLSKRFAFKV
jgi:putative flippase GtrA